MSSPVRYKSPRFFASPHYQQNATVAPLAHRRIDASPSILDFPFAPKQQTSNNAHAHTHPDTYTYHINAKLAKAWRPWQKLSKLLDQCLVVFAVVITVVVVVAVAVSNMYK
jgi:hypothetical protein